MPEFDAIIQAAPRGGAWVKLPFDVEAEFGARRVKVAATFDGQPYRGSIATMDGASVLGIAKAIRAAIGKQIGDSVRVTVEPDRAPREVEVPPHLAAALAARPEARRFFDSLAYTYRREYAAWIAGAKREETRQRRLRATIDKLARGERL